MDEECFFLVLARKWILTVKWDRVPFQRGVESTTLPSVERLPLCLLFLENKQTNKPDKYWSLKQYTDHK